MSSSDQPLKQEETSSSSRTTHKEAGTTTSRANKALPSVPPHQQEQDNNSSSSSSSINLIPLLTDVQYGSAALFSSFLVVHLAAPTTPLLTLGRGGSSAAEIAGKTMILGRVYYQSALTEPLIVWGSLVLHLSAGIAKRVIRTFSTRTRRRKLKKDAHHAFHDDDALAQTRGRGGPLSAQMRRSWQRLRADFAEFRSSLPALSQHQTTGYLLLPFLLQHTLLNRIIPVQTSAPIFSLSPSELDYTYVSFGLERYPLLTGVAYAGLVAVGSWHVVSGVGKVRSHLGRKMGYRSEGEGAGGEEEEHQRAAAGTTSAISSRSRSRKKASAKNQAIIAGTCTGVLFAALLKLGREADSEVASLPKGLLARYDACYSLVWPYSLVRSR